MDVYLAHRATDGREQTGYRRVETDEDRQPVISRLQQELNQK